MVERKQQIRWIADYTSFPYRLVDFVKHKRNDLAHGRRPPIDQIRRALATADALLILIEQLEAQNVPKPTVTVRCRGCGTDNHIFRTRLVSCV